MELPADFLSLGRIDPPPPIVPPPPVTIAPPAPVADPPAPVADPSCSFEEEKEDLVLCLCISC